MADALMQYETIDAGQIDDIMAGKAPRPPHSGSSSLTEKKVETTKPEDSNTAS
jgi:cell division protease FtsH